MSKTSEEVAALLVIAKSLSVRVPTEARPEPLEPLPAAMAPELVKARSVPGVVRWL
jgi:hypothetical protein